MLGVIAHNIQAATSPNDCSDSDYCIDENSWQLGLAVGLGGRTNPLVDGDAIPFIVLPDIAYYGESFYFDNGELGIQFFPNKYSSIDAYIAPNVERANFTFWHASNIFIPAASFATASDQPFPSGLSADLEISVDDISRRKWALDAGLRWQWHAQQHQLRLSIATDISGVHGGAHAIAEYRYRVLINNWQLSVSPHVKWMSAKLTDYYYGVNSTDTAIPELIYNAKQGLQYGLSANASYPINDQWHWLTRASLTQLHSGMHKSPLVEKSYVMSAFVGIAYRF